MAEAYLASQQDLRNLGTLINRLLDDLNRPDLQAQATEYIQDAIRYYQRKAWLFNELDNTAVATYANSTIYPIGSIIQATISGTSYAFCAIPLNAGTMTGTSAAAGTPVWPTTVFTTPVAPNFPPPPVGSAGTIVDNTIIWANVGLWTAAAWTQLTSVYSTNQYLPPLDYISPYRIEITVPNLRFELTWIPYNQLRNYDVVRIGGTQVGTIQAYPTMWSWFQQQIYLWPYPNGFYPLTLSYRSAPVMLSTTNQTSFWTTQAERMVRKWAQAAIEAELLHDPDAAGLSKACQIEEERVLRSQAIAQRNPINSGLPASDW